MVWWTSRNGGVSLNVAKEEASQIYREGVRDEDVMELLNKPNIFKQLREINSKVLKEELRVYEYWPDIDLQNHEGNLQRILWIACADICSGRVNENLH